MKNHKSVQLLLFNSLFLKEWRDAVYPWHLLDANKEILKKTNKKIEGVVEKYAKGNGYTMILNDRVLLYGQKQDDLTDEILKILNSKQ